MNDKKIKIRLTLLTLIPLVLLVKQIKLLILISYCIDNKFEKILEFKELLRIKFQ